MGIKLRKCIYLGCLAILSLMGWLSVHTAWSAGEGDVAIFRDSSGTFDTNITSYTGVPFDTVLIEDSGTFIQNANNIDVDLGYSGHYLFGYVIQSRNDIYDNRVSWLTKATLAGTTQPIGGGHGYRRSSGNDRYYAYGYGLVDVLVGDDLRIEVVREGENNPSNHFLEADRSSFWILKLDETWGYFRAQGANNQLTLTEYDQVDFTTSLENTDTNVFGHSITTNPEQITLKEAGHYLVIYSVGVDTASNRTSISTRLTLAGMHIKQSYDYSYIRSFSSTNTGIGTNMTIIEATANDILRLEWGAVRATSAHGTQTESDRTAIAIIKLPDSADYLRVYETDGGQNIGGLNNVITFDTQDEADSESFSFNTETGVTTVQQTNEYLFTTGARTNRGTSGTTRMTVGGAWYVNGARQVVGNTGMYVRGDQGLSDTFDGGWSAAGIFSLVDTDTIDFRQIDDGDDGDTDTFIASSYGITAVNLATLFNNSSGTLSANIVDEVGGVVIEPSVNFSDTNFDFNFQTTTGVLGIVSEKIRVDNGTQSAGWTLSVAATGGSIDTWSDGTSNEYDFNDPVPDAIDGADVDLVGGELFIDSSVGIITPQSGCTNTGVSLGSSASFSEGIIDSITLMSATGSSQIGCYWDLTNILFSQDIPASQPLGTYTLNLTLTVS